MTKKEPTMLGFSHSFLTGMSWLGVAGYAIYYCLKMAYTIRLQAIEEFGTVIHEYDPYFNYRATEYLYYNGAKKFFTWFDHKVWYPLGRPVGTTIYPGMQFTSVWIKNMIGDGMTLNDVCCYVPAWFGVIATFLVGCITYECTVECNTSHTILSVLIDLILGRKSPPYIQGKDEKKSTMGFSIFGLTSAIFAMWIMGIVPAHLTRSVGGGYDNESVAVSAMTLTFYLWIRSLREGEKYNYVYGLLSGIAYFYMVASWGGYVFVLNMIGLHATLLVLLGRFSTNVYLSYSLFYVVGTALAIQVPVVGLTPLKSLEQIGPGLVFLAYQVIHFCERGILRKKLTRFEAWKFRMNVVITVSVVVVFIFTVLMPHGYFGPISSRVRGLFVKHTKTGNPLVDSVAEHQPADNSAYFRYLQHLCIFAPFGFLSVLSQFGDAPSFVIVYATAAYFFSHKMVRLILLMGPVASVLGGISVSRSLIWCFQTVWNDNDDLSSVNNSGANTKRGKQGMTKKKKIDPRKKSVKKNSSGFLSALENSQNVVDSTLSSSDALVPKRGLAMILFFAFYLFGNSFQTYCWKMASAISNPSIIIVGQLRDGSVVKVDDYREAYWWIRDNTPEDARVLAWWDYGYQIASIANRTTIADGNTWNHEHIALLGKILTTNVDEGYNIARHLADYVLIWTGGGPDDLAKSPHLARIANSVYRDLCPGDPTCRTFTFTDRNRTPSPMMKASFLYNLHSAGITPGVEADPTKFKEVFRSPYGKVRVYEVLGVDTDSKSWVADHNNRICDVEGGWYCRGQYPPALKDVLDKKKDFAQLEDFNSLQGDEEYQKQYFENLNNPEKAKANARAKMATEIHEPTPERKIPAIGETNSKPTQAEIDAYYEIWEDTDYTTHMWKIISSGSILDLESFLESSPLMGFMRSSDGRGPMWWAFESKKQEMVRVLMKYGVSHTDKDKHGLTPVDLLEPSTS